MFTRRSVNYAIPLAAVLLLFGNAGTASADFIFDITITTPAAAATNTTDIFFGLTPNVITPPSPSTVTATLSNFVLTGTNSFGVAFTPSQGDFTGLPPATVTLANDAPISSVDPAYTTLTAGDTLEFQLALTGTGANPPGDGIITTFFISIGGTNGDGTAPGFNYNADENNLELQLNGNGTLTVNFDDFADISGVPEPSSLLLCGGAALAGAYRWWRRRKTPGETQA